jgi:hypothetical protein
MNRGSLPTPRRSPAFSDRSNLLAGKRLLAQMGKITEERKKKARKMGNIA